MERATTDGMTLDYEDTGSGEPVVCIHGAFVADTFQPLQREPGLTGRYRLITYHRRGYVGSSRTPGPPKRRPQNWKPRQGRPTKQYTDEYRHRWPVERTFAWLGHQRRLLVRHEHKAENFQAFYTLACIRLTLAVLLR